MPLIKDVREISALDITTTVGGFLATVAPGLLIISMYNPALVRELDSMKLFVLSATLTLPALVVNAFFMLLAGMWLGLWSRGTITRQHLFFFHVVWAFFTLYATLLVAFLFCFEIKAFILFGFVIDLIIGLVVMKATKFLAQTSS